VSSAKNTPELSRNLLYPLLLVFLAPWLLIAALLMSPPWDAVTAFLGLVVFWLGAGLLVVMGAI
jgi:hypothetical protein